MSKRLLIAASFSVALFLTYSVDSAEKEKEFKADCPVSGRAAKEDSFLKYKGGKVYFCCDNCPKAFKNDTAKFAAKANRQLVVTGQAALEKCPIAGRPLNPETTITVADVKVTFCCNNCKGKASQAEGDAQLELVFGNEAFDKGFKVSEKKE